LRASVAVIAMGTSLYYLVQHYGTR
jgi:hypothetical protein